VYAVWCEAAGPTLRPGRRSRAGAQTDTTAPGSSSAAASSDSSARTARARA
jgi:hypothetical protein